MPKERKHIGDIETPALLLDLDRVENNIGRYQAIAQREGVKLRPHGKTTKMPEVWDMQRARGAEGLTVATMREAELAVSSGHKNVLIAYPHVDPKALERVRNLTRQGTIGLLVSSKEGAEIVYDFFTRKHPCPDILLAVDTGLHREGVAPRKPETLVLIKRLAEMFGEKFRGITTHEGHGYKAKSMDTVRSVGERARDTMIQLAVDCRAQGVNLAEVAVGSTPTFAFFANDGAGTITEAHPGNYACMDFTQVNLGIAKPDECALTVLASVIDRRTIHQTSRGQRQMIGRVFINAGSKILSEAKRPHGEGGLTYGRLYKDLSAAELQHTGELTALSEEIGWVHVNPHEIDETDPEGNYIWKIGEKVRVLVQHACPAMACNNRVWLVRGERVIGPVRIRGTGYSRRSSKR